jgi:hypothetical protein
MGGTKLSRHHFETELSCGHRVVWRQRAHVPRLREKVYCHSCCDMRMVIGVPESWRGVCETCRFDQVRQSLTAMHRQVFSHLEKNPTHTIFLYNYDKSESYRVTVPKIKTGREEITLFDFDMEA